MNLEPIPRRGIILPIVPRISVPVINFPISSKDEPPTSAQGVKNEASGYVKRSIIKCRLRNHGTAG